MSDVPIRPPEKTLDDDGIAIVTCGVATLRPAIPPAALIVTEWPAMLL